MNEKLYSNFGRRKNMGIFGGGYDKPGKGVDKNEPKKKGFFFLKQGQALSFPPR